MIRIPFKQKFKLRFFFEDIDGMPVDLKDFGVDFWLSTRSSAGAFSAFLRKRNSLNTVMLDDGSVIVNVHGHSLPPGKLKAVVNVLAEIVKENPDGDGCRHDGPHREQKPYQELKPSQEAITFSPDVPVEIVDPHLSGSCGRFNPDEPIPVHVRFNMRRPQLSRHITFADMERAIDQAMDAIDIASQEDIDEIINKFKID